MDTKEDITKLQQTVNSLIYGQQQTSELINSLNKTIELQNQSSTELVKTIANHMQEQRKFIKKITVIGAIVFVIAVLGIPLLLTITSIFG
jgi:Mg2+ and Co2+ transporter CorA